ncbi:MAG: DUF4258 domain-containing protein [Chloroflexota bacterium]|nr:DUF4258 domain-containing protein [Chloroflexota bacterium]
MDLTQVKALVRQRRYKTSHHAEVEREAETITIDDIKTAILNGELLEDYPDDPRGHSCLIFGTTEDERPLHVVLTILAQIGQVLIITVYIPTRPKWLDPRTRAPRKSTNE